jgi:predicted phage terminase large subunit-like protein
LLTVGVDINDNIYVLPDVFWKRATPLELEEAVAHIIRTYKPSTWWAGKDQISGSLLPLFQKRMAETSLYCYIEELPNHNKKKRELAQPIRHRMAAGKVFWPAFAAWWPEARNELLSFDAGVHDDFVDALACIGQGLANMRRPFAAAPPPRFKPFERSDITLRWVKERDAERRHRQKVELSGW